MKTGVTPAQGPAHVLTARGFTRSRPELLPALRAVRLPCVMDVIPERESGERCSGQNALFPRNRRFYYESCQHRGDLDQAARRYQIINIKLDKAGGLTEALLLARAVRKRGLQLLVSNMGGTSLSMAPALVLAQLCKYVELDGQLLLKHDRFPGLRCHDGEIAVPDPRLWG